MRTRTKTPAKEQLNTELVLMGIKPTIHVAIPAMNERDYLPRTLQCILKQDYTNIHIWVCVNQPEGYWDIPDKLPICHNNSQTLEYLDDFKAANVTVIDHCSRGKGWKGKQHGVGMARKILMDAIARKAQNSDIIVSLDADTTFETEYLASVVEVFEKHPKSVALSNPYYHNLSGDETLDRAMLRYEIYIRHYAINLWRIKSPYCFTALGSAIAVPVESYKRIGGITPKKSGEDFYFLQKLRKLGHIANYNSQKVFPATRYSDRVFFGTGPALIKGSQGSWESYPIYDYNLFEEVAETYKLFPTLYDKAVETRFIKHLHQQFAEDDIFEPLRKNSSSKDKFVKACHQKVDGLRVLQYLKQQQSLESYSNDQNLVSFVQELYPEIFRKFGDILTNLDFQKSSIEQLDLIRNFLVEIEEEFQKEDLR